MSSKIKNISLVNLTQQIDALAKENPLVASYLEYSKNNALTLEQTLTYLIVELAKDNLNYQKKLEKAIENNSSLKQTLNLTGDNSMLNLLSQNLNNNGFEIQNND